MGVFFAGCTFFLVLAAAGFAATFGAAFAAGLAAGFVELAGFAAAGFFAAPDAFAAGLVTFDVDAAVAGFFSAFFSDFFSAGLLAKSKTQSVGQLKLLARG